MILFKMKKPLLDSSRSSQNSQIKSYWEPQTRRLFVLSLCGASIFLIICVWLIASWIYGSIYRQEDRAHNLEILVLDLDGGEIGKLCLRVSIHQQSKETTGVLSARLYLLSVRSSHLRWSCVYFRNHWGSYVQASHRYQRRGRIQQGLEVCDAGSTKRFWHEY